MLLEILYSPVSVVTRLWTGRRGFDSRFLFATVSRLALGPSQPPIQWVTRALSLGLKWPRREADHSPISSAEVKNMWSYTPLSQYAFMVWCSVKAEEQIKLFYNFICCFVWVWNLFSHTNGRK